MIKSYLYMVTILTTTTIFGDTIHFTNSQNRLLNSTNHTVYRVNVPGSEPITIIESDQIDGNRESELNEESDRKYVTSDQLVVASDGGIRRVGTSSDQNNSYNKKTVYSPELLEKFLQDYSQKVHSESIEYGSEMEPTENSAETIKEKLNEIAKLTLQMTTESNVPADEHFYSENETDNNEGGRDEDNIQEKYVGHYDDRNNKHNHYNDHNSHEVNRFNDRDGWVTLDAIPWSSSKVSKWNPNTNKKVTHFAHVSPVHPQWGDEQDSFERPRPRPPSSYEPFPPHPHDDDYYKPIRPSTKPDYYQQGYDAFRPPSYEHNDNDFSKPIDWNKYDDRDGRPTMYDYHRPKPTQEYYQSSPRPSGRPPSTTYPSDSWYNNKPSYRPHWDDDILPDDRPLDYAQKPYAPRPPRPSSSYHEEDKYVPNYYPTASQHHPQTHPSTGNGEWVLISTTKGYHFPPKHGKRAMGFQTSNGSAEKTQTIRLSVLPAESTTNGQFISPNSTKTETTIEILNDNRKPFSSVTPTSRTMTKPKVHQHQTVNTKNRRKVLKSVPVASRNSGDSTAVLAAVGAGMVPATVAMLMPMVLGRKKRFAELKSDHRITYTRSR